MEVARTFGEMLKRGWRPRRTIVLVSLAAEEYGLGGKLVISFFIHNQWIQVSKIQTYKQNKKENKLGRKSLLFKLNPINFSD